MKDDVKVRVYDVLAKAFVQEGVRTCFALLGHWATQDQAFAIGGVDKLEEKLRAAKVNFEFHRYNCKHAFANETADSKGLDMLKYDPKAAEQAWQRTMDFLAKHLK